jgi:hypothetical protein
MRARFFDTGTCEAGIQVSEASEKCCRRRRPAMAVICESQTQHACDETDTLWQEVLAILEALDEDSTLGATGARLRGGCHVCRSSGGLIDEKVAAG